MTACCPLCGADALYAMLLAAAANLAETRDTEAAMDELSEIVVALDGGSLPVHPQCPMCQLAAVGDRGQA